ncbi:MAG: DUF1501 domain-containing protein [Planctomycetota bacterium]|nr:DUF1501 domain-containing protein [Planctomycetota bacterium]MDA1164607.1 DUF1501 domain-containing protein [Planctomycetota bacterium]
MLRILGRTRADCSGQTRREWIQAGGAGLFGVSLPTVLAAADAQNTSFSGGRAKSVLFVYLFGGPSQLESFDMKPDAPSNVRGPFNSIDSRTSGLRICEHLPMLAQTSDKYCVVQTLNHSQNDHNGSHIIQTGRMMPPAERGPARVNAAPNDWPAIGSVVEYMERKANGKRTRSLPDYIYLPNRHGQIQLDGRYDRLGQYAGWLGAEHNALATRIHKKAGQKSPYCTGDNPYYRDCSDDELTFQFEGLSPPDSVTVDRLDRRRSLLQQFDVRAKQLAETNSLTGYNSAQSSVWNLLTSDTLRAALDIRREPASLRDRYGRNLFGQSLIMGRRMIEAGTRFVTVVWDMSDGAPSGWDSHNQLTGSLRDCLLPGLDRGLSALLEDLETRGLLDETLVVACGEMGRTPKFVNRGTDDGRDHWSYCFPAVLAGAGIQGGTTFGRSDKHAAYPLDHPVSCPDLAATIFKSLGIDPNGFIPDREGRPAALVDGGRPINAIFS